MLWGSEPHIVEVFRNFYGPTHKVYAALDPDRQARLTDDITALLDRLNLGGPYSPVVPANTSRSWSRKGESGKNFLTPEATENAENIRTCLKIKKPSLANFLVMPAFAGMTE